MPVQRLDFIDLSKGFAILTLLFCHTNPGETINTWIFGFHMPIFFIIGGILLAVKEEKKPITLRFIPTLLIKRCRNLILPYIIFCLALTFYYGTMSVLAGNGFIVENNLIRTFTFQGIDSLWFIPCYFWAELISALILSQRHNFITPLLILALFPGIIIMTIEPISLGLFAHYFMKVQVSLSFMVAGILITKHRIIQKTDVKVACFILIISSIITLWSGFSAIGSLEFPQGPLYFATALAMSLAIMTIFKGVNPKSKCTSQLRLFGQYSIVVLCTNNLLIEIIRLLDYKLSGNFLIDLGLSGSILFFLLLVLLEYILICLSQGPLGIIFGKK